MGPDPDPDPDDVEAADRRNGEPGATEWTETDGPAPSGSSELEQDPLETDPDDGQLPSDTDVQAERQP